jgi:hypothetical protein
MHTYKGSAWVTLQVIEWQLPKYAVLNWRVQRDLNILDPITSTLLIKDRIQFDDASPKILAYSKARIEELQRIHADRDDLIHAILDAIKRKTRIHLKAPVANYLSATSLNKNFTYPSVEYYISPKPLYEPKGYIPAKHVEEVLEALPVLNEVKAQLMGNTPNSNWLPSYKAKERGSAPPEQEEVEVIAEEPEKLPSKTSEWGGVFIKVKKELLQVDHRYQRPERRWTQTEIFCFDDKAFGVLIVARRQDGTFWVIDGQNRRNLALQIDYIKVIPCMVHDIETVEEEAKLFGLINEERVSISNLDSFRAAKFRGDEAANIVDEMIKETGRTVSYRRRPTTITGISTLREWAETDEIQFRILMKLIHAISTDQIWPLSTAKGVWWLLTDAEAIGGESLRDPQIEKEFRRHQATTYENTIKDFIAQTSSSKRGDVYRNYAQAIVKCMNKGKYVHRWDIFDPKPEEEQA